MLCFLRLVPANLDLNQFRKGCETWLTGTPLPFEAMAADLSREREMTDEQRAREFKKTAGWERTALPAGLSPLVLARLKAAQKGAQVVSIRPSRGLLSYGPKCLCFRAFHEECGLAPGHHHYFRPLIRKALLAADRVCSHRARLIADSDQQVGQPGAFPKH